MVNRSIQKLSPRTLYEVLNESSSESATTLIHAAALAEGHPQRSGQRRLIGVAMNLAPWMLRLESWQTRGLGVFDDVLFGIRARADAGNVDLLVLTGTSSQYSGEPTHYVDLCHEHGVEGIILAAFLPDEPELTSLVSSAFPCVTIETQLIGPRVSFVNSDNVSGAATAVRHLAELGRTRIAFIGASGSEPTHIERRLGYESALDEFGLELREEYVMLGGWLHDRAHDLTLQVLALPEPPDAIFCASDVMAIGAMLAIEEAGLRIPDDVAVVGFDDSDYASLVTPGLTSIGQNRIGLGAAAVEAMLRMLDQPDVPPTYSILPVELVVRESTVPDDSLSASKRAESQVVQAEPRQENPDARAPVDADERRLPVADVFHRLGEHEASPPKSLKDALPENRQLWRPEERRLLGFALETTPGQDFRHAFFDELFYGIRARAYALGADLLIFTNAGSSGSSSYPPFLDLCRRYGADGVIIASLPREIPEVIELLESGFPCVAIDIDLLRTRVAFVMSDNVSGGAMVARHLIESGRRRIAFIGGRRNERPSIDRRFGYQSEQEQFGIEPRDEYVIMASWRPDKAYEATKRLLALPEPPDAIFAVSDVMAISAMAAVYDSGRRVPDDIAIVGFDDIDLSRLVTPLLTTVRQDQAGLAETATKAIMRLLEHPDEPPMVAVLPVELVVRESSGGRGIAGRAGGARVERRSQ